MFSISCKAYSLKDKIFERPMIHSKREQKGQATAEYLLVLLMAAVVVFVVTKMFGASGSSNPVTNLVGSLLNGLVGSAGKIIKSFL